MTSAKGRAKEAVGWLTADREVEAEGRAEQSTDGHPDEVTKDEVVDEVRRQYGETPDGSDEPDARH